MSWQPRNRGRESHTCGCPSSSPFVSAWPPDVQDDVTPPPTLVNPSCHQPHSYPRDVLDSMSPRRPMVQRVWQSAQTIVITKGNFITRPGLERPDVNGPQSTDRSAEWMDTCSTQCRVLIIRCIGLNPICDFADSRQIGRVNLQHPVISPKPCMCQVRQEMACLVSILHGGGWSKS